MSLSPLIGIYRGIVYDNNDPDRRMRLRVKVPMVFGDSPTGWALPCVPKGSTLVPNVDDQIMVAFEAGDEDYPVWIGTWQTVSAVVAPAAAASAGAAPVGAMVQFAGSSAPTGWLMCDGSAVSRQTYAALFAAIGASYGNGDGSTTFNLPDARGRTLVGAGTGSGLTNRALASTGGEEAHILSSAELASHTHTENAHSHSDSGHAHTENAHNHSDFGHSHSNSDTGHFHGPPAGSFGFVDTASGGNWLSSSGITQAKVTDSATAGATSGVTISTGYASVSSVAATVQTGYAAMSSTTPTMQTAGNSTAHNNMQPYLTVNMIIKT